MPKIAKSSWKIVATLVYFLILALVNIFFYIFCWNSMLELAHALWELEKVVEVNQLENFFQIYLWKKGLLNEEFKVMLTLSPEEKKERGAKLSEIKMKLMEAYEVKEQALKFEEINLQLEKDLVDISLDVAQEQGSYSLLAEVRRDAEEICKSMGFIMEYGNEMVTKFENFESVNIPLTHPATEMHDTIYLNEKDPTGENLVLRTHTSSMQNYLIQKYWLPLKAVVPGRSYRIENMDASHDTMFYQMEGIIIDKNISIAHFKEMITKFLSALLHKDVETRMRPGYFPFVEPGFEIDVRYDMYNKVTGKMEKSKRMEILGAWMIHPNVLKKLV